MGRGARLSVVLVAVWLLVGLGVGARPVEVARAVSAADAWARTCAGPLAGPAATRSGASVRGMRAYRAADGRLLAHVVDLSPDGFVLLAPDDTLAPVLAYGAHGRFDPADPRCAVLADLVAADVPSRLSAAMPEDGAASWDALTQDQPLAGAMAVSVAPLLGTTWGQGSPYNRYTPNNWPTGCVATAMGQLIRYHQYPPSASGTNTIYLNGTAQTASFSRSYDYTAMPAALTVSSSEAQKEQVSRLLSDCGIALRMNYTLTASYAASVTAVEALTTTFGYATAAWKDGDDADWRAALAAELQAGFPVQMDIRDSSQNVGHAIVCDGLAYDGATPMYHLNMGWDGYANTWYAVPGFAAAGQTWNVLQGFVYKVRSSVPQDAFEPDNTASAARTLTSGVPQTRSLHRGTDTDWVTFTLSAPCDVELTLTGANFDTGVSLYGPNSSTSKIHTGYPQSGATSVTISRAALPAGVYYVEIANLLRQSGLETYTLSLAVDTQLGDDYEPDDTAATAGTLTAGAAQARSLHAASDVDWAVFTLSVPSDVTVGTSGTSGDTELWLFGPNSSTTQVGYDDDSGPGAFSALTRTNLAAGTYYVKVMPYHALATINAYTLTLTVTPLATPLTGVTLLAAPSSPAVQGSLVVLMATPVGGAGTTLEYRFVARSATYGWVLVREWGSSPTCLTWQPVPATWTVYVYAREVGNTAQVAAYTTYRVAPPLTAVKLTSSLPQRSVVGRLVVLAATATGGALPEYGFTVTNAAGQTVYTRAYGSNRTTWWYPAATGTYTVTATVRDGFDMTTRSDTLAFEVFPAMGAVEVSGVPATAVPAGQRQVLNATVTGGATPEYRYVYGYRPTAATPVNQTVWDTSMAYRSYGNTWWTPATPGVWTVRAYARDKGNTSHYEVTRDYTCTVGAALSNYTIALNASGITATPTGGVNLLWEFFVRPNGTSGWTKVAAFQSSPTAPWTPPASGAWDIMVRAKEATSTKSYDMSKTVTVTVP